MDFINVIAPHNQKTAVEESIIAMLTIIFGEFNTLAFSPLHLQFAHE